MKDNQSVMEKMYVFHEYEEVIETSGCAAIHIEYLYESTDIWDALFKKCIEVLNDGILSDSISAGGVATALLSTKGNIYTGVCIESACPLGFCAERNAIGTMVTQG